ncbi:MAG: SpoIID/LytB domain-containing protein [Oscillospiraceae bacterium]|nr:SpoIID/LytB domain-containing protein [Oscillospiraceae bacterium]
MTQKPVSFLRGLSVFLTCVLFLSILPPSADAAFSSRVIRVGLFYGSNALPAANLANEVGSGYQFGTYDSNGVFTAVGETAYEKITVCKDANLYLSGGSFYETPTAAAYTLVGAYHLQAAGSFGSYADALQAASAFPYGFPAYVNGQYVVRFEFYSSAANAAADAAGYPGATVVGGSASCYTVVDSAAGRILFEFDNGEGAYLAVQPAGAGGQLAQTWFKGYQYYGGFQYLRRSGNDLTVVNFVPEDLYVAGVLPYEFVASGSLESLKAGAVAVRTFARRASKHRSLGFDICNTTDCQVYRGVYTGAGAQTVLRAVEETAGECAYYQGALIEALYFSSDGGRTEDAVNAWGTDYPYLKGKEDPYEASISFNGKSWSYQVTPEALQAQLQRMGRSCGTVTGFAVTATTAGGNVNEVTVTDSSGQKFVFQRDDVRFLQNLPGVTYMSRRFTIQPNGGGAASGGAYSVYDGKTTVTTDSLTAVTASGTGPVTGTVTVVSADGKGTVSASTSAAPSASGSGWTISGGGYGHNIGMSQWGAYAMGAQGFGYREILQFYYTGITLQ